MNPATFLRVLGPEPWNVCYAEPSIRPDDSRYGDNPNRVQRHTQFQVILKPDPGNAQELYLGSLEALGIDTRAHDIRFVEDNWESPVLGAWGLGWEVWLDGMEITQFTYFQQAGGRVLEAPAVEITYGLERIMMSLQDVAHFKDIRYNDKVTYGELFLQNEYEMSVYNLDEATVEDQRARFDLYDQEARRMLAKRLPIPAYEYLLKLSHTFNILDARGAVGVTERANCFATMRALAREVTGLWVARREEQGHPLGVIPPLTPSQAPPPSAPSDSSPRMMVLEIGSEELPPEDVDSALKQLSERVPQLLKDLRLAFDGVVVEGTPRRLAVMVEGLAARQQSQVSKIRGPPAKAAFVNGNPTKALEGFCRKNNISVQQVVVEPDPSAKNVEYVFANIADEGRSAAEVLTDALPRLVSGLSFRKGMRWNSEVAYSRPLRWLLALHGDTVLPLSYAGLLGGRATRLLRNSPQPEVVLGSAEKYPEVLRKGGIVVQVEKRKSTIWEEVVRIAAEVGGMVPDSTRSDLLSEVCHLVEAPTVILGSFSPSFLQLPEEVLVMVMRKHQRYFPVYSLDGGHLLPHFITVANGEVDRTKVAAGNESVLRARFEDATFFYREDLRQPLAAFRPRLSGTMFQKDLGSLLDKTERVEKLVAPLAEAAGLVDHVEVAQQAAHLAKADLATSVVMEMTALAGTMGRHYALKEGLAPELAEAIFEAALPRQAGDKLPASGPGILAALADRLDSLVGLVAAVGPPSATADPYGLRRTAYGLLQTILANDISLDLRRAVALAASLQPVAVDDKCQTGVVDFVVRRLEQLLTDEGVAPEVVRAVLSQRGHQPCLAMKTATTLQEELAKGEEGLLRPVMTALSRPTRIVRSKAKDTISADVKPQLFEVEEEKSLYEAYVSVSSKVHPDMTLDQFLTVCNGLCHPVDAFFDRVFVMCDDEAVRNNRLALLQKVAALTTGVVDFTQLPGF